MLLFFVKIYRKKINIAIRNNTFFERFEFNYSILIGTKDEYNLIYMQKS